ncbi:hypothetical protein B2G71_09470 [Novosphingobium sp. PC22D]|nr:hypothetical protein B2G71_09470 [Novosphingobium sp. PC22D]
MMLAGCGPAPVPEPSSPPAQAEARALKAAPARARASSAIGDFLIQNVCVEAGAVVPGDPASCPTSRDIRAGETPPYRLTDSDEAHGGKRYQAVSSIPDAAGRVRIAKQMDDGSGFHDGFVKTRDGYDLIEHEGAFVSIIATSDQQCWEQRFSGAGEGDGWVLFPNAFPLASGSRRHDMTVRRLDAPEGCPAREAESRVGGRRIDAVWHAAAPFTFESGKTLEAIRSEHIAHHDLSRTNNAIETFIFTREYGWSRWEAWIPRKRCRQERGQSDPACRSGRSRQHPQGTLRPGRRQGAARRPGLGPGRLPRHHLREPRRLKPRRRPARSRA